MNKITESLIKSRLKIVYASCLHIFRHFGQNSAHFSKDVQKF